jgi:hypothetical protein
VKKRNYIILFTLVLMSGCSLSGMDIKKIISSPNERVQLSFYLENGKPLYDVYFDTTCLIKPSRLGFVLDDEPALTGPFTLQSAEQGEHSEIWQPVWGIISHIENHFKTLHIKLQEKNEPYRYIEFEFRSYNDGIAFRTFFPEQPNLSNLNITDERTEFVLNDDYMMWWIPADYDSYENLYKHTPVSTTEKVHTPATMMTKDSLYLSIHEANLTDYASMTLLRDNTKPHTLNCDLVPWPDGIKVKAHTPFRSPWRTIQIAEKPGDLLVSHLILNLNESCALEDVSWIKPMKYLGIWWGMHIGKYTWATGPIHGATTANAKRYIDYARRLGIEGLLIEGWNIDWNRQWFSNPQFNFLKPAPDFNLEEIARYAVKNGVYLIGHHETGANVETYEQQIDSAFALFESLGIHAVKTGYVGNIRPKGRHHHGQYMVRHYRSVVKKAAQHQIMLDVHEPIKPTGIERTYPNMMTREGVRGMEYNAWSDGNPPEHTTILPFTRMLAGPLDYTPGIFDLTFDTYRPDKDVHTTLAKQLALYVILFSPLQMAADLPENYEYHPAFSFIQQVPTTWDETRIINARIGDFVTIARRVNQDWYIGSISDESPRSFRIPLSFLDNGKSYTAQIYRDGPNAHYNKNRDDIIIEEMIVEGGQQIIIRLAPGGGQAIILKPMTGE